MSRRISGLVRSHLLVVITVFVALGGSAWAAATLPNNSISARQLRNGSVTSAKIKNGAITAAKIKNGAITAAKINLLTLPPVPSAQNAQTLGGLSLSALQLRVNGTCPTGRSIVAVAGDGSVSCATNGGPPSGAAGGDLSGTYPNPQVQESNLTTGGDLSGSLTNAVVDTSKLSVGGGLTGTVSNATIDASKLSVGGDLTGTAANAQIGAGAVGDAEIADRTTEVAVPVQQLLPLVGRAGTTATATDIATSNVPALAFSAVADQQVEFVLPVPRDRVTSSAFQVAVDWSTTSTGLADWKLDYLPLSSSAVNGTFKSGGSGGNAIFSANSIGTFCCLAIPSGDLFNGGEIVVRLTRVSSDPSDTAGDAHVESVRFSYTASR